MAESAASPGAPSTRTAATGNHPRTINHPGHAHHVTNTEIDPAADPDFAYLLNLLSMLPGPKENPRFWALIQAEGHPKASSGRPALDYVFEKMAGITLMLNDPTPARITHLCKYLLFFFSPPNPALWKVLNDVTPSESSWGNDQSGQWWAEDITRTAWKLYVRYHQHDDESWMAKWHFERNWTEWLPDRQPES